MEKAKNLPPIRPIPVAQLPYGAERPAGRLANLRIRKTISGYAEMVEAVKTADSACWRIDDDGSLWVPLTWWNQGKLTVPAIAA
jgi:hypothetical protein